MMPLSMLLVYADIKYKCENGAKAFFFGTDIVIADPRQRGDRL